MIRKCTITAYSMDADYSFVGDVYYNDEHEVIETNQGVVEYEMKVKTDDDEASVPTEGMVFIETFDGTILGRKKIVGSLFTKEETIIYLK